MDARQKELADARYARYRLTEKYRAAQERRRQKDRANGWPLQRAAHARLRTEEPHKLAARYAVASAVRAGLIAKATACSTCGSTRAIHAHHPHGYEPHQWLDIEWLCAKCHRRRHVEAQ